MVTLSPESAAPDKKTTIVPNGADMQLFNEQETKGLKSNIGFDTQDFIIGFIGFVGKEWVDFSQVLTALRNLRSNIPSLKLLIVGGGDGLNLTREKAAQLEISEMVIFSGYVEHEKQKPITVCEENSNQV